MRTHVWAVLLGLLLSTPAWAQLQSPADFLGYELGTQFTPHHRVVDYVQHVAEQSANVQLEPYGETYEGRPLMVAYIAKPEHLSQLETIRTDNLKRTGMLDGEPALDPMALVWLSYNVHGNESVSTEAAMQTLYELADPSNARTQAWLDNAVVILDPCINPDGRDRYVHWYNETVGRFPNVDPSAREHNEPWPGGRANHYYFDLNRDWAWQTQQESQQRLVRYHQWMPHVHVDFHEQGVNSPYFFAPAAEPLHEVITPWQREFQMTIGQNHARYFDANGWLYFTRQVFDLLYPSYGDTWPTYNGAIGMTYEQGGSGRAGLGIITAEGDTLTLADRIRHHHTTGLSTVEVTAQNHAQVVDEFEAFYTQNRENPPGDYQTYIVKASNNVDKLHGVRDLLDKNGIAYGRASRNQSTNGFRYATSDEGRVEIEAGDLVVSAHQPKGTLVTVLFEPETNVVDSLTYDITAWAVPYAHGVEAMAVQGRIDMEPMPASTMVPPPPPTSALPYAYLAEWKSLADARFIADVLEVGIKLRYATRPFRMDGAEYDRGTMIITRRGNEAMGTTFDATVAELARAHNQALTPVTTGFVDQGDDFGSGGVRFLERPNIAILSGEGVSSYASGEAWHFFDQQLEYPVTVLYPEDLRFIDLSDYDVLVLPPGSYGDIFPERRLNDLRSWMRSGGRVVALESAATFFSGKDGFSLERASGGDDEAESADDKLKRYGDRSRESISDGVIGAVFRVQMDPTHPLAFGYGDTYHTLKRSSRAYQFLDEGWNVGALRPDSHVSGFVGYQALPELDDTLVFGMENVGRGGIVYMIDNPLFRGFWDGGKLLFVNAVFLR
ncbi:MAG: M14 family metallopeptidase [Rhodothermales bacterium]